MIEDFVVVEPHEAEALKRLAKYQCVIERDTDLETISEDLAMLIRELIAVRKSFERIHDGEYLEIIADSQIALRAVCDRINGRT